MPRVTPTPWRVEGRYKIIQDNMNTNSIPRVIVESTISGECNMDLHPNGDELNARFIVRAVNSHYELLAVCKELLENLKETYSETDGTRWQFAIDAITKAEEKWSLYNTLFGMNPLSDVILATLGLTRGDTGRFRDCFVADGKIAVYTRNGGGNREEYQPVIDALAEHPCYLFDQDDDFDSTYATIYFSFPEQYAEILKEFDTGTF